MTLRPCLMNLMQVDSGGDMVPITEVKHMLIDCR